MDDGLKKRLIGAAVLASLAVIFVPMLFEEPPARPPPLPPLPSKPPDADFASSMLREEVPAVTPLAPATPPAAPDATAAAAPAAETPRTGLTAWVVQAASLSSRENADKLVARLRAAQLPTPDPELVDIQGKRYYRVRVGPVVERTEAEGMLDKVSEIAGTKAQVRQYP
ncbi:MAG: SPOR domain-containing protein [Gammaproteobacteria bacterium]|nr:SPOR domain-containing protein [Gammaproteobacteria bacterium]